MEVVIAGTAILSAVAICLWLSWLDHKEIMEILKNSKQDEWKSTYDEPKGTNDYE